LSAEYPSALEYLLSPESFDPGKAENVLDRHTRRLVGSAVGQRTPVDDDDRADYWTRFLVDRVLQNRDTTIIVDGLPGEGKSNFALWLASRVRWLLGKELGVPRRLDLKQDVVSRLTLFTRRVYQSSREKPLVVIADEGVLVGAQGTSGLSDAGRLLDRVLSVDRIQACTVFILHPSVWGLASFVRNRRAYLFMHVEQRGITTVFLLKDTLEFTPPRLLPFKKARYPWSRLYWPSLENDPIWAEYEPWKLETVRKTLVDAEIEAARIEKKAGMAPPGPEWMDYWDGSIEAGEGGEPVNARAHARVADGVRPLPPPPAKAPCRFCGRMVGAFQLTQHEAACPSRAGA
jgi:hypothetical protein